MNYKKFLLGVATLTLCFALIGCGHEHTWVDATCTEPKTCSECGETEGEPLGHTWVDATCSEAKHCSVCGKTEGESLEHTLTEATNQQPATCEICGATVGEPIPALSEDTKNEFNKDVAEAKVADLFNARNELFKNGKVDTDLNFLVAAESITGGIKLTGIKTADGLNTDEDFRPKHATVANYFYDFVNNNSHYYDLGEYLTSHTFDEIIDKYSSNLRNDYVDTDMVTMMEAPGVLPYLLENLDNLSFGDLISGEECTAAPVSDVDVYYEMPILINGEKCGVTAVFDEAGNLLNLITVDEDGWTDDNYRDSTNEVLALEN